MPKVDKDKVKLVMKEIKNEVRAILNKHAADCSAIAVNSQDPHSPVIACVQMALVEAAMDYLRLCGVKPEFSLSAIVDLNGKVMMKWVKMLTKTKH